MAKVAGVFDTREQAEKAVRSLRDRGFGQNEISIVAKDGKKRQQDMEAASEELGRQGPADPGRKNDDSTMGNVSDGTAWGGAIGGTAGLLAGIGALAIPGIGPIVAAGPIAATLTGAVAGGLGGGLIDLGLPEQDAKRLESDVQHGKVLAMIEDADDQKIDNAAQILRENGANDVNVYK